MSSKMDGGRKNTHKYISFNERLSKLRINVVHKIERQDEIPEETETFFHQSLTKLIELECSLDFQAFTKEVSCMVKSLSLLVYHKESVVGILQQYMKKKDSLALNAFLELCVQLSRDLQEDFTVYFPDFLKIIASHLETKDAGKIEECFKTLAYLFKFQWRFLIKDMNTLFSLYSPLLNENQPGHLYQFAAESFAFLLRKTKDLSGLVTEMFTTVSEQPNLCKGVGKLFSETVRGVQQQFNSCTEKVLTTLLDEVGSDETYYTNDNILQVFYYMFGEMAKYCAAKYTNPVWNCLINGINKLLNNNNNDSKISFIIRIMITWVRWRDGHLVLLVPSQLYKMISILLEKENMAQDLKSSILKLSSSLLLCENYTQDSNLGMKTLQCVFQCHHFNTADICQFVQSLKTTQSFIPTVVPMMVKYYEEVFLKSTSVDSKETKDILLTLARIVKDQISFETGFDSSILNQDNIITFNFLKLQSNPKKSPFKMLLKMNFEEDSVEEIWSSFVCLPCIRPLDFKTCVKMITTLITKLYEERTADKEVNFVLAEAIKSLSSLCLFNSKSVEKSLIFEQVQQFLTEDPGDVYILQASHVYLSVVKQQEQKFPTTIFSKENLIKIYPSLESNLSSHQHLIRLLTLKLLVMFERLDILVPKNQSDNNIVLQSNIFQDCLDAELVPLSFTDYRQKLILLQKLVYTNTQYLDDLIKEVPLRYLLGVLYVNLSTMWEPVMTMITTYTTNTTMLWKVIYEFLSQTTDNKTNVDENNEKNGEPLYQYYYEQLLHCTKLREDSRVDYNNFKLLLWKTMGKFPEIIEPRSRQIIPLFLDFIRNECSMIHEDCHISYQSLLKEDELNNTKITDDTNIERTSIITKKPLRMKTLSACLTLFTHFKNPQGLYKEPEMRALYLVLLTQKDCELQQLAFNCLLTYKEKYLVTYKENIERLLDDKTFKEELISFSANEFDVVDTEHREALVEILIRILYGKMQRWTGSGTRGKGGTTARRSLVLRFLNNCHGNEMMVFINLICQPFQEVIHGDTKNYSIQRTVSLRKQLGFLNMFSQIIDLLGAKTNEHLSVLLKVLIYCLSISHQVLVQPEQIEAKYLSNIKAVRQLGTKCLSKVFEMFPSYDYQSIMDDVFNLVVNSQIERLSSECLQSPTPLLKLLSTWCKNPQHHVILSRLSTHSNQPILAQVFACLTSDHVQSAVTDIIMQMTDNLLNETPSPEEVETSCPSSNDGSVGPMLVIPHITTILNYLHKVVKKSSTTQHKQKAKTAAVSKVELQVLSKVSVFIKDSEQSSMLALLLIPLLNNHYKVESQLGMLTSLKNLVKNIPDSFVFIVPLAKLFTTLTERRTRNLLCDVFSSIGERNESIEGTVQLLHDLNAWDKRQVDEPDFERRLLAFSKLTKLVKEDSLCQELTMAVLHNATYFALRTSDVALRYAAISFVRAVMEKCKEQASKSWVDSIIFSTVLPAIKEAVKSKQESARNEFVLILGSLVRAFEHDCFMDLKSLLSEDPEVDFFENIVHIQVHRRIRALRRFSSIAKETVFTSRSLTTFILPLVTHFVYEYTAAKDHNIITEAINTIGVVSLQLPWQAYFRLLRHYLRILPREKEIQKIIVRIVVAILESFHFDLTQLQDENIKEDGTKQKPDTKDEEQMDMDEENMIEDEEIKPDECPLSLQLKIHDTITQKILPQLQKCLTKKMDSHDFHRLSGRKENDNDEILRVPVILAMVKLLQSLPKKTLQTNLPGLLLRVCQALKSRAFDVRDTARGTLSKITNSLGIYYFPFILNELRSSLLKGYQLHVLSSTLHYILTQFGEHIPNGGLDVSAKVITEVLIEDIFGEPAREREVEKIATKLPEARSTKSLETFEILAKNISVSCLTLVTTPLKEVLHQSQSHKVSQRAEEILRRINVGLQKNPGFSTEHMLVFVHGLVNEKLSLVVDETNETEPSSDQVMSTDRPDTYIIPSNPLRGAKHPQVHQQSYSHLFLAFGFQLLLSGFKKQKLLATDEKHVQMLDPFVSVLTTALSSKHTKITTLSLRCLCWIVKFPLPSLRRHVVNVASQLFKLLKNYAHTGRGSGDNYEMVLSAFKTITTLIRDFIELKVTDRQLRILLTFVEEDIHDYSRQSCAFPLLKAILSRRLQVSEINDVMLKVAELAVTDDSASVRLQCRQVLLQFLLDYPLGKKLRKYLEFFVSQLEYEHASGRESALEMIVTIVTGFPEKVIYTHSGLFFLPLCTRLVNDEVKNCRKLTAVAIKTLLRKLDVERRDSLFGIVLSWLKETKLTLRRLACHVCGLFVEVETKSFERRISTVLPILADIIQPEKFPQKDTRNDEESFAEEENNADHLLINTLMTLTKILQECGVVVLKENNKIWDSISSHLLYPHTWIRLVSARLFGLLFSQWTVEEIVALSKEVQPTEYIAIELTDKVSQLCGHFLHQLKERSINEELGDQVVKNLFYLGKIIILITNEKAIENNDDRGFDQDDYINGDKLSLQWLLTRMCNIAKYEASHHPKLSQKRLCVLRWIAAIASHLGAEKLSPYLTHMLQPVYREIESVSPNQEVQSLAQEVSDLLRNIVGLETFSLAYSGTKQNASQTREKRKQQHVFEAVANPEAHVAKKIKKNIAKKESRKRKLKTKLTKKQKTI